MFEVHFVYLDENRVIQILELSSQNHHFSFTLPQKSFLLGYVYADFNFPLIYNGFTVQEFVVGAMYARNINLTFDNLDIKYFRKQNTIISIDISRPEA